MAQDHKTRYEVILPADYPGAIARVLPSGATPQNDKVAWERLPDGRIKAVVTREELDLMVQIYQQVIVIAPTLGTGGNNE